MADGRARLAERRKHGRIGRGETSAVATERAGDRAARDESRTGIGGADFESGEAIGAEAVGEIQIGIRIGCNDTRHRRSRHSSDRETVVGGGGNSGDFRLRGVRRCGLAPSAGDSVRGKMDPESGSDGR